MRIEQYIPAIAPALQKLAASPREVCGVITRAKQLVEIPNRAADPCAAFDAGPLHEIESREGELMAIWHTHPENQPPSQPDIVSCTASFLPWIIAGPAKIWVLYPEPMPYAGREFEYGSDDCLGLVTDWLGQERCIRVPWFARPPDGWWNVSGPSPYLQHVEACGFAVIPFLECGLDAMDVGDVLLMQVAAKRVNHAAIYLGSGMILHHLYGELSRAEQFDGRMQRAARFVCRAREAAC